MTVEHFNVLIVGAGLSGIDAGYHLATRCPDKRYAILEGRKAIGGTWDLFRYPGVRSDSDMHTLGFSFRPWTKAEAIADGPSILQYLRDTAREFGIDRRIRFDHRVHHASWSSAEARWTVDMTAGADRQPKSYTCDFLYLCSGYYSYENAYTPDFPARDRFSGRVVHPQHWPKDLDYHDKRVIVIGSGATAVSLVPALAESAAHVTMLQRSPSYIVSMPARDRIDDGLRRVLPWPLPRRALRWKNVLLSIAFYQYCRRRPASAKRWIRRGIVSALPDGYPVDTHFKPSYNPWDQRLCLVPDADLFKAIKQRRASIVTDPIDTFTENGIRLKSGGEIQADIVVTATGLSLVACGGIQFTVDGSPVDLGKTLSYKGLMVSDMPNFATCIGYTNASWTLRADLASLFVCRLLGYMDRKSYVKCVPRNENPAMDTRPLLNLSSGYIQRGMAGFPKQGTQAPWQQNQNFLLDLMTFKFGAVNDKALEFSRSA